MDAAKRKAIEAAGWKIGDTDDFLEMIERGDQIKHGSWDKEVAHKFRQLGLNQEQIGMVIGEIAEHRQLADREGFTRGFENGVKYSENMKTIRKKNPD